MARTRASSFVSWNIPTSQRMAEFDNDMEEDERMVEELLIPSSPVISNSFYKPVNPHLSASSTPSSPMSPSFQNSHNHSISPSQSFTDSSSPSSVFTSTDPFYMAQLQASQSYSNTSPQSVFSQNGHISQSSPFSIPQYHHHHHHSSQYQNWDNQPMAMTAAAF